MCRYDEAFAAYHKAVTLDPLNADAYLALAAFEAGTAYKILGQLENAIQYFEIAGKDRAWLQSARYEIDMIKRRMK